MKKQLEPYGNIIEDLLYWIKQFFIYKFTSLKKEDHVNVADFSKKMLAAESIDEVVNTVREASKVITGVKPYYQKYREFYDYIKQSNLNSIKEINQSVIKEFILKEKLSESDSAKENYYTRLKTLFNFIQEHHILPDTDIPFLFNIGMDQNGKREKILSITKSKSAAAFLKTKEMVKLDASLLEYSYENACEKARDILIIRLFMFGCITMSELQSIQKEDFCYDDNLNVLKLHINGRSIPLLKRKFTDPIKTYLQCDECKESAFLFCGRRKNAHINDNYVRKIIAKHFEYAGLNDKKATSEILRNSGIIYLYRQGISEKMIQKYLGNKSLQATKRLLLIGKKDQIQMDELYDEFIEY